MSVILNDGSPPYEDLCDGPLNNLRRPRVHTFVIIE